MVRHLWSIPSKPYNDSSLFCTDIPCESLSQFLIIIFFSCSKVAIQPFSTKILQYIKGFFFWSSLITQTYVNVCDKCDINENWTHLFRKINNRTCPLSLTDLWTGTQFSLAACLRAYMELSQFCFLFHFIPFYFVLPCFSFRTIMHYNKF